MPFTGSSTTDAGENRHPRGRLLSESYHMPVHEWWRGRGVSA